MRKWLHRNVAATQPTVFFRIRYMQTYITTPFSTVRNKWKADLYLALNSKTWIKGGGRWYWAWGRRKSHEWDSCGNEPLQEVYVWNYSTELHLLCSFICISYHAACWMLKGVHARSVRRILLIFCKINLFVNTVLHWDVDMMLHSDLPRAPQLSSPLLETPWIEGNQTFLELLFSTTAKTLAGVAIEF